MNMIDEIKEDLEIFNATTEAKVVWLIERLEQAENIIKGMESAIEPCVHEDGHTLNWEQVKLRINRYVGESLQAIRK